MTQLNLLDQALTRTSAAAVLPTTAGAEARKTAGINATEQHAADAAKAKLRALWLTYLTTHALYRGDDFVEWAAREGFDWDSIERRILGGWVGAASRAGDLTEIGFYTSRQSNNSPRREYRSEIYRKQAA